jgi:transposase-like protein
MARDGILCPRCINDWVQPSGGVVKGVQWFVCPSCSRYVAFSVDTPAAENVSLGTDPVAAVST